MKNQIFILLMMAFVGEASGFVRVYNRSKKVTENFFDPSASSSSLLSGLFDSCDRCQSQCLDQGFTFGQCHYKCAPVC